MKPFEDQYHRQAQEAHRRKKEAFVMYMVAFRVENYRSITDSGWVGADGMTVIVGKNESGKTSLLKALWKFNPYKEEPYDLSREWPRGRRREMSVEQPVVTVRFAFTPDEHAALLHIDASASSITGVEIQRNYKGTYTYNFLPNNPEIHQNLQSVFSVIKKHFGQSPQVAFGQVKDSYRSVLDAFFKPNAVPAGSHFTVQQRAPLRAGGSVAMLSPRHTGAAPQPAAPTGIETLQISVENAVNEINIRQPIRQLIETVHGWLPTFIYMDDYKVFKGSAQLDQIKQRKLANKMTDEDRTIVKIMEMAGLQMDEEVKKASLPDREQRILDLNDASQTLTAMIADRWSQKKYDVLFQADGHHFITFVKNADTNVLVPLEERSKGFQWFFSFDMTFMYETNGEFKNAIILLDEPGLHLHAAAQSDLLVRLRAYAQHNQLIYTTHLPFMIDLTNLDHIYIAEEVGKEGTRVHNQLAQADKDARFTLQAALGLSRSASIFADQYNLIVEGLADYVLLTTFSEMLIEAGHHGLDARIVITPAGGASQMAYVGTQLHGQQLHVAVLLSSSPEQQHTYDQLLQQWATDSQRVLCLAALLTRETPSALEDLLDETYYLKQVAKAYRRELRQQPLHLAPAPDKSITDRVAAALAGYGIDRFDRERVTRWIMRDLAGKTLAEIPERTTADFTRLFAAINEVVAQ